ncbi:MAG: crossover junction endodeoxyribonuclease RuvC [Deltaproteobacteria bacterium]|nr:crossover junction endodeoxyribonuclease RuvC [Deltaproteobacteria bacterium]
MTRIIGIDPGLANAGWGVLEKRENKFHYIAHGSIKTDAGLPAPFRLKKIFTEIQSIISEYQPEEASVETLYFAKNVKTALPVAEARGVLILGLMMSNVIVSEYTPLQIKQAVVGNGHADKNQVQQMVKLLLSLKDIPRPDHASDALAAAICHANMRVINV